MRRCLIGIGILLVMWTVGAADEPAAPFQSLLREGELALWRGRPQLDPRVEATWPEDKRIQEKFAWDDDMRRHWQVVSAANDVDSEIISDGEGVFLTTADDYDDFEFTIEWKMVTPRADSGIYLRGYPQVQIWDPANSDAQQHGANRGSGALWNNSEESGGKWPLVFADHPVGEWNSTRIRMVGSRVWVWLNDKLTVNGAILENYWDRSLPVLPRGCLQLQTHGGEFRFRRPAIRRIDVDEANAILRKHAGDGFKAIWDGKSMAGWRGPVQNCEIVEESLIPMEGTVYTEREFGNFELQFEFLLPPGGNNGLAIRYPGHGDAAYDGMCELQILDSEYPEYASLDPRQYHGSAYGIAPAHRGYLRQTGSWNFQLVRVTGSRVYVELNGTPILDADLTKLTNYLDNQLHPGKVATSGHLGLCGHNSPVRFRNLAVREITP